MAVRIGHASLGESGKVKNGAAGDQTGKEVFTRDWYLHGKGWVMLRCNDADKRDKIAKAMEMACANDQIGYDQTQRDTLFNNIKNKGFDTSKTTTKVETDCSALVRVCVAYAYGKDVVGNINTSSEPAALVKTGLFTKFTEDKYCKTSDYLMRGDILCTKTKGHTVIVLSDGSKAEKGEETFMSNSPLATIQVPAHSSNYTKGRESTIKEITIHHMAGRLTAKRCGEIFQAPGRNGSTHYGVGYDGQIGQYVDEANTAWSNSNRAANHRAVTIETANDSTGGNWPVNDVTLNSLIKLVADIAKRNGLVPLVKGKNLTWHQMYSATTCPGPYLLSKIDYIIQEANKIINGDTASDDNVVRTPVTITYQVYDGAWLGNITGYDTNDKKYGYAGGTSKSISGVYANASIGNVYYRSKLKDGGWLGEIKNREDYSGILGKPIDGFMIRSDATQLYYRAHDKTHGWLGEISGYDMNDANNGYAGWTGYEIDAIMIRADDIVTIVEPAPVPKKQLYRIRLTWADAKSQVGAYSNLENAKSVCPEGYGIYDEDGNEVYRGAAVEPAPETPKQEEPSEIPTPNPTPEVSGDTPETKVYDLNYPSKVIIVNEKPLEYDEKAMTKVIKGIVNNNAGFDIEIAKVFFKLGAKYRIDPVMALAQSVLETGWFKYNGSAVKPEQHNYCGLGVTSNGLTGGSFNTIEDGVTAQLQHLYSYGCKDALPEGEEILDPRFKYVTRGIAPTWQQLAGRWAVPGYRSGTYDSPLAAMKAGNTYGQRIEKIAKQLLNTEITGEDVEKYFPKEENPLDNPELINPTQDYNGDGVIDQKDAEYLLFHINFPDKYPLPAVGANPPEDTKPEEPNVEGNPSEEQPKEEPQPTPVAPTEPPAAKTSWLKEIIDIIFNFFKSLFSK